MPRPADLPVELAALRSTHRYRRRPLLASMQGAHAIIDDRTVLAFASNDYLGLAADPRLVAALRRGAERDGCGAGASALVTGYFAEMSAFEQDFAAFVGMDAALAFGSGYMANLGVIGALCGRGDAVFADKLAHASILDGCRLSGADFQRFRHNDLAHLEALLRKSTAPAKLIAVDAVYSMDGDEAPLAELLALAERFDAWLYVDDAHGFGVLGGGRGSAAEQGLAGERLVYLATFGKAAGVAGAAVAGSAALIDWLVNRARTAIFTTACPPALAHALRESLALIGAETWRRERLDQLIERLRAGCAGLPWALLPSRTPIQPLIVGHDADALALSARLLDAGIRVPAIRPPTVPPGTARLRISLSAAHTPEDVDRLVAALRAASGQSGRMA